MNEQEKSDRMKIAQVDGVEISEERILERIGKMTRLRKIYQSLVDDAADRPRWIGVVCAPGKDDSYVVQIGLREYGRTFVNTLLIDWRERDLTVNFRERERDRVGMIVKEIADAVLDRALELKRARSTTTRRKRDAPKRG